MLGPIVENHPLFPQRMNFEVANVLSRGSIRSRVWERGAGETQACGSGACAVAVAARLHGHTDDDVDIILPGGTLKVEWDGRRSVWLSGPAEFVFSGEWMQKE
jgi:diaminopimelate epimerase